MRKVCLCFVLLLTFVGLTGCASTRITTTPRTAVEQALLTRSAADAVDTLDSIDLENEAFALKLEAFNPLEKEYYQAALTEFLLSSNGRMASPEEADIIVVPRSAFAAIDDSKFLIGIPSIQFPVPGTAQAMTLPDLSLFKRESQIGRAHLELFGYRRQDGALAFTSRAWPAERTYTRWTLLLVMNFRSTNLGEPF